MLLDSDQIDIPEVGPCQIDTEDLRHMVDNAVIVGKFGIYVCMSGV